LSRRSTTYEYLLWHLSAEVLLAPLGFAAPGEIVDAS
jgi:hypothetical protein